MNNTNIKVGEETVSSVNQLLGNISSYLTSLDELNKSCEALKVTELDGGAIDGVSEEISSLISNLNSLDTTVKNYYNSVKSSDIEYSNTLKLIHDMYVESINK